MKAKENCNGHEDAGFVAKHGRGVIHAEQNICSDFLFDSKKTTADLDNVEPKVLLRTVGSSSITGVWQWTFGGAGATDGLRPVMQGRCVGQGRSAYPQTLQ